MIPRLFPPEAARRADRGLPVRARLHAPPVQTQGVGRMGAALPWRPASGKHRPVAGRADTVRRPGVRRRHRHGGRSRRPFVPDHGPLETGAAAAAPICCSTCIWRATQLWMAWRACGRCRCFLSARATIRARVAALRAAHLAHEAARAGRAGGAEAIAEAPRLFRLARSFLVPHAPRLVAVGGRSGSGKSTLARELSPRLGPPPGAVHLQSDVERKAMFGLPPDGESTRRGVFA